MSYILDALKKSDQQRQHGAAPTLASVQFSVPETRQRKFFWIAGVAAALFVVGILVGWWRPWQPIRPQSPTQPGMPAEEAAIRPPLSNALSARTAGAGAARAPVAAIAEAAQPPTPQPQYASESPTEPLARPAPQAAARQAAAAAEIVRDDARADKSKSGMTSPKEKMAVQVLQKPVGTEPKVVDQRVLAKSDLPGSIQQELPKITVSLHAYSSKPQNRLVSVNDQLLHEGDSLSPGLVLEQIAPEDMVFSYKGFRFRQELR